MCDPCRAHGNGRARTAANMRLHTTWLPWHDRCEAHLVEQLHGPMKMWLSAGMLFSHNNDLFDSAMTFLSLLVASSARLSGTYHRIVTGLPNHNLDIFAGEGGDINQICRAQGVWQHSGCCAQVYLRALVWSTRTLKSYRPGRSTGSGN